MPTDVDISCSPELSKEKISVTLGPGLAGYHLNYNK